MHLEHRIVALVLVQDLAPQGEEDRSWRDDHTLRCESVGG
jgi:hypothetical protein